MCSVVRKPRGRSTSIFYTTIQLSSTVTFATLPGFSVTLPPTVNPTGLEFFYAISDPKPSSGAKVQFRTEGPATVSGQIVTFAPSTTRLTLAAGQPYTIAFYALSAIAAQPTPTPPPPGKIYVIADYDTVETFTTTGVRTTPTITGLNGPSGVAVDANGKIYVANNANGTVTTYTPNGTPTTPTIGGRTGYVRDIAIGAAGKIYVASDIVRTYTPDGLPTTPTIANVSPVSMAADPTGKIYLLSSEYLGHDTSDYFVAAYDENGAPTAPTIELGDGPYSYYYSAMAVDASGKIYLTVLQGRVDTYTAAGVGTIGTVNGLIGPVAIAVH
jgi:hypothetical protein